MGRGWICTYRLDEQTVPVDTPEPPVGLVRAEPIDQAHAVPDLTSDTHTGRTRSVDNDPLVGEGRLGDTNGTL
jgi:hypothetical protein